MKTHSLPHYRFATISLVALSAIAGIVHAQQKASPSPGPTQQSVTTRYYESEEIMKGGVIVSTGGPGNVTITRFDGVPVRVAAASGGGLMIDLGVLRERVDKGGKSTENMSKAHPIIKVPMDLTTLSVTIGSNFLRTGSSTEFEDRHGNHLSIYVNGPMNGPGGSF